ncbi:Hypothetical protein GLP15_4624 [Giardia lamblia P15]|uniref:Leucine-rich repeat protein n=1 Tax=Giardia intestinalis (strain P15) TaxID=658858 RepID=E1F5N7_GIAIA|nr:Hypothetical protein GLP15_4624 [Giardia lamblia P15]
MGDSSEPSSELDDSDAVKLFESYKLQRAQRELDLATYLQTQRTEELAILTKAYGGRELPEAETGGDYLALSPHSSHEDSVLSRPLEDEDCTHPNQPEMVDSFQDKIETQGPHPLQDEALQREMERLNYEMMLEMRASSNVSQYIQTLAELLSFSSLAEECTEEHKARQKRLSVVRALSYSALARKHVPLQAPALLPQLLPAVLQEQPIHRSLYEYCHQLRKQDLTRFTSDLCETAALLLSEQRYRATFIKELAALTLSSTRLILSESDISSSFYEHPTASVTSLSSPVFVELTITEDNALSWSSSLLNEVNVFVTMLSIRGPLEMTTEQSLVDLLLCYFNEHPPLHLTLFSATSIESISIFLTNLLRLSPPLVSVTIDGCNLTSIALKDLGLTGSLMLLYLDLSNNALDTVTGALFPRNLVSLNLSNNRISQFECMELSRLQVLRLGGNSFTHIPPLQSLPMLTQAYLENNRITHLDLRSLADNPRLAFLSLNNNNITALNAGGSSKRLISLDSLEILTLKGNPLESICFAGAYFPKLQSLELSTFLPTLVSQLGAAYLNLPRLKLVKGDVSNAFLSDTDMQILRGYFPRLEMLFNLNLAQRSQGSALSVNPPLLIDRATDVPSFVPNKFLAQQVKGSQFACQCIARLASSYQYVNSIDRSAIIVCSERNLGSLDPPVNNTILQWPIPGRTIAALQSFEGSSDLAFVKTIGSISALLGLPLYYRYSRWSDLKGDTVSSTLLDTLFRLYIMLQRSRRSSSLTSAANKFTVHHNPVFIERVKHKVHFEAQVKVIKRYILQTKFYLIVVQAQNVLVRSRANLAAKCQILKYRATIKEQQQRRAVDSALALLYLNIRTGLEVIVTKEKLQDAAQKRATFQLHLSRIHANMATLLEKCQVIAIVEAAQFLQSVVRAMIIRSKLVLYICEEVKRLKKQERCHFEETRMATQKKLELEFAQLGEDDDDDDVTAWALKATRTTSEVDNILVWANNSTDINMDSSLYDEDLFNTARGLRTDIFSRPPPSEHLPKEVHPPAVPSSLALSVTSDVSETGHSDPASSLSAHITSHGCDTHQLPFRACDTRQSRDVLPPKILSPPQSLFKHEAISIPRHSKKIQQPYIPKSRSAPRQLEVRPVALAPADQRSLEYKRRQTLVKNADSLARSHQDAVCKQHTLDPILRQIKTDGWDLSPETAKTLALKRKKELAIARAAQASDWKRF